jgi:hypothetical protein
MEFEWEHDDADHRAAEADRRRSRTELLKDSALRVPAWCTSPPMTGLSREEPEYTEPKQLALLGQGRPGEVLRNLLVTAHKDDLQAWGPLQRTIERVFGCSLMPPDTRGENIIAEYRVGTDGPKLDIASAGSGFQQVLMLLTFLYTRAGSVLLVDEPDAHLHMILQGVVYNELNKLAAQQGSQLVIATHSEVIIDEADLGGLRVLTRTSARSLTATEHKGPLKKALKWVTQADIVAAITASGVLYVEGYTDHRLLLAWAGALKHPAEERLRKVLVKTVSGRTTDDEPIGLTARDHYNALSLFFEEPLRAIEITDGDSKNHGPDALDGGGLRRLRWRRYEIESYLIHPRAIGRFVLQHHGDTPTSRALLTDVDAWFDRLFRTHDPNDFVSADVGVEAILTGKKARGDKSNDDGLMTTLLDAAKVRLHYRDYDQMAAKMEPEDIHPEVVERLNAIARIFEGS